MRPAHWLVDSTEGIGSLGTWEFLYHKAVTVSEKITKLSYLKINTLHIDPVDQSAGVWRDAVPRGGPHNVGSAITPAAFSQPLHYLSSRPALPPFYEGTGHDHQSESVAHA